jgi:hypothetical protein
LDLELEVRKLVAERDIRDKLYRYQEAINRADRGELERFFGDAVIRTVAASNPDNVHREIPGGKPFVDGFLKSVHLYDGVPHVQYTCTNVIIQLNAAVDAATCHAQYLILQGMGDYDYDNPEAPREFPLQVCGCGRYFDTWALKDGEWRMAAREIYSDMTGNYIKHMKIRPAQIREEGERPEAAVKPKVRSTAIAALRPPA